MRLLALFALTCSSLFCQNIEIIPWKPSPILATGAAKGRDAVVPSKPALYLLDNQVFPHLATGGGWETVIVMVNMSSSTLHYNTYFYSQSGAPMTVTFRTQPAGNVVTTSAMNATLPPRNSFNFSLYDATPNTKIGYAIVEYDSADGRLGGYAVFRQRVAGRPDFEALVPLSSYSDHKFYLPIDEIQGFQTAIALCNPASNTSNTLTLLMMDLDGNEVVRKSLTLGPGVQTAFIIQEQFPQMIDRLGTLYVEGSSTRLSAIGLRFNTRNGSAFSSVPIMNYLGMF